MQSASREFRLFLFKDFKCKSLSQMYNYPGSNFAQHSVMEQT